MRRVIVEGRVLGGQPVSWSASRSLRRARVEIALMVLLCLVRLEVVEVAMHRDWTLKLVAVTYGIGGGEGGGGGCCWMVDSLITGSRGYGLFLLGRHLLRGRIFGWNSGVLAFDRRGWGGSHRRVARLGGWSLAPLVVGLVHVDFHGGSVAAPVRTHRCTVALRPTSLRPFVPRAGSVAPVVAVP